ncbi:MAG: hypothetical protein IKQ66_02130 [Treponema sp.]|nr:hypothetical protein [Treponema sp.]
MVKKVFAAAAVLLAVSVSAFALEDSEISVPVLFNEGISREVFENDMYSDEVLDNVAAVVEQALDELGVPIPVIDVEILYEDDYDEDEDLADMFDFVLDNIPSRAKSGSIYFSIGIQDFDADEGILYGYAMFAHVNSRKDIMFYSYYFTAGEE